MQITRQSEYAIRALIELASTPEGTILQSRAIAKKHDLPEKFLNKTIQLLSHAGFIETKRGMHGGIKLAVSPDSITIADVITAIEGKISINPCLGDSSYCNRQEVCRVHHILQRAQRAMLAELNKETIADLADPGDPEAVVCHASMADR